MKNTTILGAVALVLFACLPAALAQTAPSPVTRQVLPGVAARDSVQVDIDNDGDGDLLLAGPDRLLRILLNDGTDRFVELRDALPPTPTDFDGVRVGAADLDGDGDVDIVACGLPGRERRNATCRIFAGRLADSGALRFEDVPAFGSAAPALELATVLMGDFDGDRDPDLLLFSAGAAGHLVYRNDSEHGRPAFTLLAPDVLPGARAVDAAIFDEDRRGTEIYVSGALGADQVLVFDPDLGRYVDETARRGVRRGWAGGRVAVADFDLDGRLDVFVLRGLVSSALLLQGPDGRFSNVARDAGVADTLPYHVAVAAEDFDRNRRPDIFMMDRNGRVRLLLNRAATAAGSSFDFVDAASDLGITGPARASAAALFRKPEDCDFSIHLLAAGDRLFGESMVYRFPDDSAGRTILAARDSAETFARFDGACVQGTDGADRLVANRRTSVLRGGAGDDTLVGSAGVTVMRGGPGADRFEAFSGLNIIRLPPEDIARGETIVCDPRMSVFIDTPLSRDELEGRGVVFEGCFTKTSCTADQGAAAIAFDPATDDEADCHAGRSYLSIGASALTDFQQVQAGVASKGAISIGNGPGVGKCAFFDDCYAYGLDICLSDSGGPPGGDGQCYPSDFDGVGAYVTEWCDDPFWARERFQEVESSVLFTGKPFVLPVVFWLPRSSGLDASDACTFNGTDAPPTTAGWHESLAKAMGAIIAGYGKWGITFDFRVRSFIVGSGSPFVDPDNPCKTRIVYSSSDANDYDAAHPNAIVDLVTAFPSRYSDGEVNVYLVDSGFSGTGESSSFAWNGGSRKFMILHGTAGAIGHEMGHELGLGHPYDNNLVRSKVTLGGISYAAVESRDSWNHRPFPDPAVDRLHVCYSDGDCTGLDAPDGACRKAPGSSKGFCRNLKVDCGQGGDHVCDTPWDTAPCFGVDSLIGKRCTTDDDCHKDAGWIGTSTLAACGIFGRCYKIECSQNSDCASGLCVDGDCANKFFDPNRQTCCDIHSDELLDHNHNACYEMKENGTIVPVPGVGDSTIWPSARTAMTYHRRVKGTVGTFTDGQRDAVVCRIGYQKKYGEIRKLAHPDGGPCSLRPGATSVEYGGVKDTRLVSHGACQSGVCSVDTSSLLTFASCVASTCSDGVVGAGEADIDCGGVCPSKCDYAKSCRVDGDCLSGSCRRNRCQPTCSDGVKNDVEISIDTGASGSEAACGGRGQNQTCRFSSDCADGLYCDGDATCVVATDCPVNQVGVFETSCTKNTDCNGGTCATKIGNTLCQIKTCGSDDDCTSGLCDIPSGRCACDTSADCPDFGDSCLIVTGFCRDECMDGRCMGRCKPQIILPPPPGP